MSEKREIMRVTRQVSSGQRLVAVQLLVKSCVQTVGVSMAQPPVNVLPFFARTVNESLRRKRRHERPIKEAPGQGLRHLSFSFWRVQGVLRRSRERCRPNPVPYLRTVWRRAMPETARHQKSRRQMWHGF